MRRMLCLALALTCPARTAHAAEPAAPAPSRILPQHSRDARWNRSSLGIDIVQSRLQSETDKNFSPASVGLDFAFEQHAHGPFWGSVHLGLENWRTREAYDGEGGQSVFPIRLSSEIIGEAPLWLLPGSEPLAFFRPYATGGLGYMMFSSSEGNQKSVLRALRSEGVALWGAGVRLAWNDAAALRLQWKSVRGLETSRIRAALWSIGIQFGDLARR